MSVIVDSYDRTVTLAATAEAVAENANANDMGTSTKDLYILPMAGAGQMYLGGPDRQLFPIPASGIGLGDVMQFGTDENWNVQKCFVRVSNDGDVFHVLKTIRESAS